MDCQLAYRAVEIDIRDAPCALILVHQITEPRRLAIGFDDPCVDDDICTDRPLAGDLQLLARIAVEAISIGRRNVVRESACDPLLLGRIKRVPGRPEGE